MKFSFSAVASIFASALLVGASPAIPSYSTCDVSSVNPELPSNQYNLTMPSGQHTTAITLGVGVQNYTCSDAGVYTSIGAVAVLLDISCFHGSSIFDELTTIVFDVWNATDSYSTDELVKEYSCVVTEFGQHYFIKNPFGDGISPVFDARTTSHKGDPNGFTLDVLVGTLAAPTGPQDVNWLQLKNVQGDLAKTVFRLETRFGQPPMMCKPGSKDISVKYTAQYWFLS